MEKRNVFDFEKENYNLADAIELIRTDPMHAMWFIDKLTDYDIARVVVKEWDRVMENKHEK